MIYKRPLNKEGYRPRTSVASDVDLFVVYAGRKRQDDYTVVKRAMDIPRMEPHLYTENIERLLPPRSAL